jgi:hypothetical protein
MSKRRVGDKNKAAGAADAASCHNEAAWTGQERNRGFILQSAKPLRIKWLRLKSIAYRIRGKRQQCHKYALDAYLQIESA